MSYVVKIVDADEPYNDIYIIYYIYIVPIDSCSWVESAFLLLCFASLLSFRFCLRTFVVSHAPAKRSLFPPSSDLIHY